jgi:hypothetical protein
MTSSRPTFEEYRALSAEERELVRLDEALAFAKGEVEPAVVKRTSRRTRLRSEEAGAAKRRPQAAGKRGN